MNEECWKELWWPYWVISEEVRESTGLPDEITGIPATRLCWLAVVFDPGYRAGSQ
jgi:hypothetical protein